MFVKSKEPFTSVNAVPATAPILFFSVIFQPSIPGSPASAAPLALVSLILKPEMLKLLTENKRPETMKRLFSIVVCMPAAVTLRSTPVREQEEDPLHAPIIGSGRLRGR